MGFNKSNNLGRKREYGRGGFGGRDSGRDSGRATMHQATCAQCGNRCEVPFRPTGDKPVYCNDCFKRDDNFSRRPSGRDDRRPSFRDRDSRDKQMFEVTCDKCHKLCEVPFKPSSDKPVYCSDCFKSEGRDDRRSGRGDGGRRDGGGSNANWQEQFQMLDRKLDKIISALNITIPAEPVKKEKVVEKTIKEEKPAKVEKTKVSKVEKKSIKKTLIKKNSKKK